MVLLLSFLLANFNSFQRLSYPAAFSYPHDSFHLLSLNKIKARYHLVLPTKKREFLELSTKAGDKKNLNILPFKKIKASLDFKQEPKCTNYHFIGSFLRKYKIQLEKDFSKW